MKQTSNSKFNNYISDYDKIRHFLRYISYGCYHKQYLAKKLGYSDRKYDNHWSQVRAFIPQDRLQDRLYQRRKYHSLRGDNYYNANNYLAKSFHIKSLTINECFLYITVLQILGQATQPLQAAEIIDEMYSLDVNYCEDISVKSSATLYRFLKAMEQQGLIISTKQKKIVTYSLPVNPLKKLNPHEASTLITALAFYRNIKQLNFPFHYLEETIRQQYISIPKQKILFQFRHHRLVTILDELTAAFIIYCIKNKTSVKFKYNNSDKETTAIPLRLINNRYTNHQYLEALIDKHNPLHQYFRLDKISNLVSTPQEHSPIPIQQKSSYVKLLLHTKTDADFKNLQAKISDKYSYAEFNQDNPSLVTIKADDPLQLLPWLRTLHPAIEILEPSFLRKRIIQDIKEVLSNYENA